MLINRGSMDSYEATDHEPTGSICGRQKRRLSLPLPPCKRRRPSFALPPSTDVSMQSNIITAGHDVKINIAAVDLSQTSRFPDMRTLANWVSPLNHHKVHKDIHEKVTEGTGSWIFRNPKFNEWLLKKTGILWGTGIPGAGKTCLTSIIIEHLIQHRHATVIFVYCQYNDELSTAEILACMLKQMIETSEEVAQYVLNDLHKKCLRTETRPSKSELLTALRAAVRRLTNLYLVVDALDELRDDVRPELVRDLMSLQQPVFLTSRPLFDLPDLKEPDFDIQTSDNDLHTYISTRIASFPKLEPLLRGTGNREEIITKIQTRCSGMFLLAALQVDALVEARIVDTRGLRHAVEHLPTSLYTRYERTLERIEAQAAQERDLARRVIVFATYATRSLHVGELLDALAVDSEAGTVEEERRTAVETLIGVCLGLVTIEKETRTVRLIHYTAQEFFKSRNATRVVSDPHTFIADTSAAYMIHANIDPNSMVFDDNLLKGLEPYPFLAYACSNLGYHTYQASHSGKGLIPTQVQQLFRKRPTIPMPLALLGNYVDQGQAIHFAAHYGLETLFKEYRGDVDRNTALGCSPVFYACLGGHITLVGRIITILGSHLQIGYPTTFGATALHAACRSGHLAIVHLLLSMIDGLAGVPAGPCLQPLGGHPSIDINTTMLDGRTALHIASENGHESVVRALLSYACSIGTTLKGILINAKDKDGETALHLAAQHGHDGVVRLLLNSAEIEVNSRCEAEWTPLHNAVQFGHKLVVQLLLNTPGIEVNARDAEKWTPLHFAAQDGHGPIIQLLLNSAAIDVNARNGDDWTPLHLAIRNGHELITRLLLSSTDIDVNAKNDDEWTPLHLAIENELITRLLLNSPSIEVNATDGIGWTPLHIAAEIGDESSTQLLLNSIAIDINSRDEVGWTPLHLAAQHGHEGVVRLLLGFPGANANIRGTGESPCDQTPLEAARSEGHDHIVALFAEMGFTDAENGEATGVA